MLKYHMHKSECEITDPAIIEDILRKGKYATLAMSRQNEPYIVTLNYGYDTDAHCLYFHTAKRGLKLDILKDNPTVCGTIISDNGYKQGLCTHAYCSVVFTGIIEILDDNEQKSAAIEVMLKHLENDPNIMRERLRNRNENYNSIYSLRLVIDEITCKEGK